jgi:hypothetical protein
MKNDRIKNDCIKSDRIKNGRMKSNRIKTDCIKSITDPLGSGYRLIMPDSGFFAGSGSGNLQLIRFFTPLDMLKTLQNKFCSANYFHCNNFSA